MTQMTAKGILLDIEGTTSSISFVYDAMFPFVRENASVFLADHWEDESVQSAVGLLAIDLGHASVEQWLQNLPVSAQQSAVVQGVIGLMDDDVKVTGLKQIQGLIWKSGFRDGRLVAHLFDDVAGSIAGWNQSGLDVRIYSSGSIQAQKLFFGHTIAGDLLDQLKGHYDTTTGGKRDAESYSLIADEFDCLVSEIVFVSDVVEELEAAKTAGMQTVLSIRPGNQEIVDEHDHFAVTSFTQIQIDG
ncbi:MAG: enolase-phosphatase E1 [Mariniblastus sp.]|jgi:enolase-phosphatase E1